MENTPYSFSLSDDSMILELNSPGNAKKKTAANVILFLAILTFIMPVLALFLLLIPGGFGISFSHFIILAIFWALGFYLIRLVLWNKCGKEVFMVSKGRFIHYNDYKYFKDNYKEIELTKHTRWEMLTECDIDSPGEVSLMQLRIDDVMIVSHRLIPVAVIQKFGDNFPTYC